MIEGSVVFEGVTVREQRGDFPGPVRGLTCDSRAVQPGDLFVALRGTSFDGHNFLSQVQQAGACAAVVDHFVADIVLPQILVQDTLACLPRIAANVYEHPADQLKLVGITGSNGKTTTAYLIESILKTHGISTAMIGTIEYRFGDHCIDAPNTTPLPHELQSLLRQMVDCGATHLIMEVSSHGLALHRVDGLAYHVALFTNLSQDHLDFHKTMEEYREAKRRLFTEHLRKDGTAILNVDDETGRRFRDELTSSKILTFAIDREAHFRACDIEIRLSGCTFVLETWQGDRIPIHTSLVGRHNIANILGAAAAAWALDIPLETVRAGIEGLHAVPGRLESVPNGMDAQVVVDYCHTPDALEKCLIMLNAIPHKRIITLFGCGGDRDRGKRPIMGEIALRFSDHVIVTSDNPRTEDPLAIIQEIEKGMQEGRGRYTVIADRRKAIQAGVALLESGDIFLLAGKGHETYQILGRTKHPFDDREIARAYLKEAGKGGRL